VQPGYRLISPDTHEFDPLAPVEFVIDLLQMLQSRPGGPKGFDKNLLNIPQPCLFDGVLGRLVGHQLIAKKGFGLFEKLGDHLAGSPIVGILEKGGGIGQGVNLGMQTCQQGRTLTVIVCLDVLKNGFGIDAADLFFQCYPPWNNGLET
jgi:hypothetical protein